MPHKEPPQKVAFERPLPAQMMAIDGTWLRSCAIKDISDHGATLIAETIEGLNLNEFFLLLSSTGLAYRRCQLDSVNGTDILVAFLKPSDKRKQMARAPNQLVR
jgi:hypothetical protein